MTSGVSRRIRSWTVTRRLASLIEMLGSVTGMKRRLPSFSGGMNSFPIRLPRNTAARKSAAARPTAFFRLSSPQSSAGL